MLLRDLSRAVLPDRVQRWRTTQIHASSRTILLCLQSKSSLESATTQVHPCISAWHSWPRQAWLFVRSVASSCLHLPHAGCGGLDFHGSIQYHALRSMPCRRSGAKLMAMEKMALQGFELARLTKIIPVGLRVPEALVIAIEAIVMIPA